MGTRKCILIGLPFTALAMVNFAVGMAFGLVGLQYAAVSDVSGDDAGIASGIQRAADQLGGATGIAVYIGFGFAPMFSGNTPYLVSSQYALNGLGVAGLVASRISVKTARGR